MTTETVLEEISSDEDDEYVIDELNIEEIAQEIILEFIEFFNIYGFPLYEYLTYDELITFLLNVLKIQTKLKYI
jgi:hypothetical protein